MVTALVALLMAASPDPKEIPAAMMKTVLPHYGSHGEAASKGPKGYGGTGGGSSSGDSNSGVPGIDSIKNWTGQFSFPGYDSNGNPQSVWPYQMVGNSPEHGGTKVFEAPVIPVIVDLLDADGSVAVRYGYKLTFDARGLVKPVLQSPVFERWPYITGKTQWTDAQFREEFLSRVGPGDKGADEDCDQDHGWHNLLDPDVKQPQRMQIPYGYWYFGVNPDGSPLFALVDEGVFGALLFPPTYPVDNSTPVGAAELAGDITTRAITTLLFNNVYLYQGSPAASCCTLGFHTYDLEPGTPQNGNRPRLYVMNYSSWIANGLFTGGFEDVTALSHELAETFNDPFVDNWTPWYLSPSGLCQNNLETGDAIEGLSSNSVFTIQKHGRTYHPQNQVNFQWFAFESTPDSFNGAYSFPDETTLTTLSPPNLLPNCVPAP